jgi:hypothetical protein
VGSGLQGCQVCPSPQAQVTVLDPQGLAGLGVREGQVGMCHTPHRDLSRLSPWPRASFNPSPIVSTCKTSRCSPRTHLSPHPGTLGVGQGTLEAGGSGPLFDMAIALDIPRLLPSQGQADPPTPPTKDSR